MFKVLRFSPDYAGEKWFAGGEQHSTYRNFKKVGPDCQSGRPNGKNAAGQAVPPYLGTVAAFGAQHL